MGGDGQGPRFVVPDWKQYGPKVDEIPILKEYKAKLAAQGLKDPWIRNEVWRFMPENSHIPIYPLRKVLGATVFRDFIPAAIVAAITVYAVKKYRGDGHHGDHAEH